MKINLRKKCHRGFQKGDGSIGGVQLHTAPDGQGEHGVGVAAVKLGQDGYGAITHRLQQNFIGGPTGSAVIKLFVFPQNDAGNNIKYPGQLQEGEGALDDAGVLEGVLQQENIAFLQLGHVGGNEDAFQGI